MISKKNDRNSHPFLKLDGIFFFGSVRCPLVTQPRDNKIQQQSDRVEQGRPRFMV